MSIRQAFNSFMEYDFKSAVDASTRASWNGDCYSVELLSNGNYRVLDNHIKGYNSPGLILSVPYLDDEEWDEDPSYRAYDYAEEEIRLSFEKLTV